jgi:phage terminase small subunit
MTKITLLERSGTIMSLTPKQEAFCLTYIETGNASEAYRQAYSCKKMKPETINRNAKSMLDDNKIATRVAELQKSHQERHNVTVDSLTDELDEVRTLAMEKEQVNAAVNATMGKAKLHGLLTDRVQHSGSMELAMSPEWVVVRATVMLALQPHPDALKAVSDSLRTLEGHNG